MKKFFCSIFTVIFLLCASVNANAGLMDGLKGGKKTGGTAGGEISRTDIDFVYSLVAEADNLLKNSVNIAFKMLANKDEIDEMDMRQKQIDAIKDPKEKEAEIRKVQEDKMASTQKAIDREETSKKTAAMSTEQKILFGGAMYNLALAGLKDKEAVTKAKNVSQNIQANPSASMGFSQDVPKLKNIVTTVPPQAEKISTLSTNLVKFASKNKIEVVLPQSSSEQPKDVDNF
jgi:hypothetical protein